MFMDQVATIWRPTKALAKRKAWEVRVMIHLLNRMISPKMSLICKLITNSQEKLKKGKANSRIQTNQTILTFQRVKPKRIPTNRKADQRMLTTMRYSSMILMTIVMKSLNSFRCRSMRVKVIIMMKKMKEVPRALQRWRNKNQMELKQQSRPSSRLWQKSKKCLKNRSWLNNKESNSNCGKNSKKSKS